MAYEQRFMDMALAEARMGTAAGEGGPFGAVVVREGLVVGKGHNRVIATNDPTAHAEVMAIRDACRHLQSFQLTGCEIYATCEPCPMCLGAIYWARPVKVYFAASRQDAAQAGFDDALIYEEVLVEAGKRRIPMDLMPDRAVLEFMKSWKDDPQRKEY